MTPTSTKNPTELPTIFANLFKSLSANNLSSKNPHLIPPKLTKQDREMLKMFLYYDLYLYFLNSFNIYDKEDNMFNPKLIRSLLIDLIKNEEHTLRGIENTTRIPLDVLEDIILELNVNPSINVSISIMGYYIISKRQEYTEFIRKIFQWVEYQYQRCD